MKRLLIITLAVLAMASCTQQMGEIVLYNDTLIHRVGEMVEVDAATIPVEEGEYLVIRNAEGEQVPYQITHDDKLIFQADVKAGDKVCYTVGTSRIAPQFQTYACGRVYPERVDDVAWESDLIAYRAYGPALQKSGERAFGYDVWVKNNTDLPVVEERYAKELNPKTKARIASLRESGKVAAADSLAASVSYHNDHGNGFDPYKVGPTLGAGATALLYGKSIVYPYCYSECEILDNGPLRFTAKLTYLPTTIGERTVTETRTISIDHGSFLNKTTVCYNGSEGEYEAMSGIVLHEKEPRTIYNAEQGYVTYAEPVEPAEAGELYLAMYFPEGWESAEDRFWNKGDDKPQGAYGHAAVYNTLFEGETLTYWWGGLWNKATAVEVPTKEAFDELMAEVVAAKKAPLQVSVVAR